MTVESSWKARTFSWLRQMSHVLKMIEVWADPYQDTQDVCAYILGGNTLDDCSGEQLDFMGELVGVRRPMLQEDDDNIAIYFRLGDTSDPDNSQGYYNSTDGTGGYYGSVYGLNSITNPGAQISDADYRVLIRSKGTTFFQKATVPNIATFLLTFGARCKIDDDTTFVILIEPAEFDDLNDWERWYATNKGFKPAGIRVDATSRLVDKEAI